MTASSMVLYVEWQTGVCGRDWMNERVAKAMSKWEKEVLTMAVVTVTPSDKDWRRRLLARAGILCAGGGAIEWKLIGSLRGRKGRVSHCLHTPTLPYMCWISWTHLMLSVGVPIQRPLFITFIFIYVFIILYIDYFIN